MSTFKGPAKPGAAHLELVKRDAGSLWQDIKQRDIEQSVSVIDLCAVENEDDDCSRVCIEYQCKGTNESVVSVKPSLHEQLRKYPQDAEKLVDAMNGTVEGYSEKIPPEWAIPMVELR